MGVKQGRVNLMLFYMRNNTDNLICKLLGHVREQISIHPSVYRWRVFTATVVLLSPLNMSLIVGAFHSFLAFVYLRYGEIFST